MATKSAAFFVHSTTLDVYRCQLDCGGPNRLRSNRAPKRFEAAGRTRNGPNGPRQATNMTRNRTMQSSKTTKVCKGKKRAAPPSPTLSAASEGREAQKYVESNYKHIKREPGTSPVADPLEDLECTLRRGPNEGSGAAQRPSTAGADLPLTPLSSQRGDHVESGVNNEKTSRPRAASTSGHDDVIQILLPQSPASTASLEVPPEQLYVLGHPKRHFDTPVFRSILQEALDQAFTIADSSLGPGRGYLEQILERLRQSDAPPDRVSAVKEVLMREWQRRMIAYVADTTSAHEFDAIVKDFTAARLSTVAGTSAVFRDLPDEIDPDRKPTSIQATGSRSQSGLKRNRPGSRQGPAVGHDAAQEPSQPIKTSNVAGVRPGALRAYEGSAVTAPLSREQSYNALWTSKPEQFGDAASHERTTAALTAPKSVEHERKACMDDAVGPLHVITYPDAFAVFMHHLEASMLLDSGCPRDVHEDELFQLKARWVYGSLTDKDRRRWERRFQRLSDGDQSVLNLAAHQEILTSQHVFDKMCSAWMVPFNHYERLAARAKVLLVCHTPDAATITSTTSGLEQACTKNLQVGNSALSFEVKSEELLFIRFKDENMTRAAWDREVKIDDTFLKAEHLQPAPPWKFVCDFTDIAVDAGEVALQIARTLRAPGPDRATLWKFPLKTFKESPATQSKRFNWKCRVGPMYMVRIPRNLKICRFYVPVPLTDSDEVFLARFEPLKKTAPCMFCRATHKEWPCAHADEILLPEL